MSLQNNCLYCNSEKITPGKELPIYFNEKEFTWNRCKNCGLLFLLPPLSDDDKKKMYNSGYHETYYFNYTEDYSRQLELIKLYQKKTFLDYGCGDAGLLKFLQTNSYVVTGVEYDINLVEKLASKFRDIDFIVEKEFWGTTEKYDIIHLGDVLEHVSNPIKLIEQLKTRLNPGGIFFIEGPLEGNPCFAYYFRKCTYFIRYIFNKESLRVKYPYHILK
jgi:2-polyprenyl-3-methyl-5-hydroxy-6-metoxy-1,4-benzoquinol methylase